MCGFGFAPKTIIILWFVLYRLKTTRSTGISLETYIDPQGFKLETDIDQCVIALPQKNNRHS